MMHLRCTQHHYEGQDGILHIYRSQLDCGQLADIPIEYRHSSGRVLLHRGGHGRRRKIDETEAHRGLRAGMVACRACESEGGAPALHGKAAGIEPRAAAVKHGFPRAWRTANGERRWE